MEDKGYVKLNINDGIGEIEFFHPQSNSLPAYILEELANTINTAGKQDNIKVIILKSGGDRTFCAGASFDELLSIDNKMKGEKFFSGFANVINEAQMFIYKNGSAVSMANFDDDNKTSPTTKPSVPKTGSTTAPQTN